MDRHRSSNLWAPEIFIRVISLNSFNFVPDNTSNIVDAKMRFEKGILKKFDKVQKVDYK